MASDRTPSQYYEDLQVHPRADAATITLVYRNLAKKYHPDLALPDQRAEFSERMQRLNAAYEVLSDSVKRKAYDLTLSVDGTGISDSVRAIEVADVLAEAAKEGGGQSLCYQRSADILKKVVEECGKGEIGYIALQKLAIIQYEGLVQCIEAAESFLQLAEWTPKGADYDAIIMVIGECHCKLGRFTLALDMYDRAIRECVLPDTMVNARIQRAEVLVQLTRFDLALEAYGQISKVYGGSDFAALATYRSARILDSDLQRYPEAIAAYKQLLIEYPGCEWAKDCQWRIDHIERRHILKKAWWE